MITGGKAKGSVVITSIINVNLLYLRTKIDNQTEVTKLIIVDRTEIFSVINIMLVISIFNLL